MIMNDATVCKSSINKKRKNIIPKNKDKKNVTKKKEQNCYRNFSKGKGKRVWKKSLQKTLRRKKKKREYY